MENSNFHFNDKQRIVLRGCWKRQNDRKASVLFLQEAERLIADWQSKNVHNPSTAIKQQIALANNLQINVEKMPALLEKLPQDFEKLLAVVWLQKKYGDEYFKLCEVSCRKDRENNTARKLMSAAAARALTHDKATSHPIAVAEFSKLPPNYFQQDKTDAVFLRAVASAAGEIAWMLRISKAWTEKPDEVALLLLLAYSYERHFGKLPSAGNAGRDGYPSPFRSFLMAISDIISAQSHHLREYKFGAVMTRKALIAIKNSRRVN